MRAVVLVGGEGTRLRPLTERTPKPAVTLVDRPFLAYMIEWLAGHGVEEVVLACGFLPDRLREVLGEGEPGGPRLRYAVEPEPLGTAGAIRFAAEQAWGEGAAGNGEPFLALNGDCLSDLDLSALMACHERAGAIATLGLYPVADPAAFGLVLRDPAGAVTEFLEKPEPGSPEAERAGTVAEPEINAGIYVLEPEVLGRISAGRKVSIEREVFPGLVGEGLQGMRLEGYWQDIGTPERYLAATWDILEGRVRTAVEPRPGGVLIDPSAEVAGAPEGIGPRAVIGPECEVGAGATITGSVLHRGCRVGAGATVLDSILAPGARVAPGAEIGGQVIGPEQEVPAV